MTAAPQAPVSLEPAPPDPGHLTGPVAALPRVRLVDTVATGSLDHGLSATSGRLIEFSLDELDRFTRALGDAGLVAFIAYLRVLRRERDDHGQDLLVLDEFSGAWLHRTTDLGRNAAFKAQGRLIDLGVFRTLKAAAGVGARGRQRAVLNPALVATPGIGDSDLAGRVRQTRSGRPSSPVYRNPGNRHVLPESRIPGTGETGPDTQAPAMWETGNPPIASDQPNTGFPPPGPPLSTGTTSSRSPTGIGIPLLSGEGQAGIVLRTLRPALTQDADHTHQVLHRALNTSCVMARVEEVAAALRLPGRSTQVLDTILDHFAGLLADPAAIRDVLRRHAVNDTVHRRYTDDQAVERYIVGLVTALGYTKTITSFGAWLYSAYRPSWTPRVNDALKAFLDACDTLAALEERRSTHPAEPGPTPPPAHRPLTTPLFDQLPPGLRPQQMPPAEPAATADPAQPSLAEVADPARTAPAQPEQANPQRPEPPRPPAAAEPTAHSASTRPRHTATAEQAPAAGPPPGPANTTAVQVRALLPWTRRPTAAAPSDELVATHLEAAAAALPHLSRHGPMDDPGFRRQLVRVYLTRHPVVGDLAAAGAESAEVWPDDSIAADTTVNLSR